MTLICASAYTRDAGGRFDSFPLIPHHMGDGNNQSNPQAACVIAKPTSENVVGSW
jgi:hypothetical protein